jgi:hypothetical protein
VVVTEYGIADLRGRTDEEVATALLEIADARFQQELLEEAIRAGKIPRGYRIPDAARQNRPERLAELLSPFRQRGLFEEFPFGTELTREELGLKKALTLLKRTVELKEFHLPGVNEIRKTVAVPDGARPYLARMGLAHPHGPEEQLMERAVVFALASAGVI